MRKYTNKQRLWLLRHEVRAALTSMANENYQIAQDRLLNAFEREVALESDMPDDIKGFFDKIAG